MFYVFIIWLICVIFNVIYTYYELKHFHKYFFLEDIFMFLSFGVFISPVLSFINIIEIYNNNLKNRSFLNPFYKGK